MGVPVTVDSDDLKVVLFATGVVKNIEAALRGTYNDEQWKEAQGEIRDAHDRVANAWRGSLRRIDLPHIARPPTEAERENLRWLAMIGAANPLGIEVDNPAKYRPFVGMGLVEIGVHEERVQWNVGSGTRSYQRSERQRLRLTPLAIEELGGILELTGALEAEEVKEEDTVIDRILNIFRRKKEAA